VGSTSGADGRTSADAGDGRPVLVGVALLLVSGTAVTTVLLGGPGTDVADAETAAPAEPVRAPVVRLADAKAGGTLSWRAPLAVRVKHGTLEDVQATGPSGTVLRGSLAADGSWTASTRLVPSSTYRLRATVTDAAGQQRTVPLTARTTAAQRLLTAALSPGDDAAVGVGQPVAVRLDNPVTSPAARAALVKRLTVRTSPAVPGAWRWMSSYELHYRAAEFWEPGTKIDVTADLRGLRLPELRWGSGRRTASFTVGRAFTSVVDTRKHTMTVSRGGRVVRVMKASMGKPEFPTRNGVFLVLEKFEDKIMDSATVDLPPGTPAYRTARGPHHQQRHLHPRRAVVGGQPGPHQRQPRLHQPLARGRRVVLRPGAPRRRGRGGGQHPGSEQLGRRQLGLEHVVPRVEDGLSCA